MDETTNRLKLPLLVPNQSGKEFTHNEALVIIDNMLQNHIISKTLNIPPAELNTGDMYIVAIDGVDDWQNKDNKLAIYDNGWRFVEPINGMLFYVLEENCFYVYENEWKKLEDFIDFIGLKNTKIDNLQEGEVIKYDGNNFVNTRELNLLKLYINNKLLLDENLNISVKNDNELINIMSITASEIDFKNNVKIAGVIIDDYITNIVNEKVNNIINDIGVDKIQNCLMPDYTTTVSITGGFTATYNGWLVGYVATGFSNAASVYINGVEVAKEEADYADVQILMSRGDVFTTNASGVNLKFLKLKGN